MAASFTTSSRTPMADYIAVATMTCDTAYPSGGYLVTPATFGLSETIDDIVAIAQSATLLAEYVAATGAIRILMDTGSGLVENTTSEIHTLTVLLLVFGR